MKGSLNMRAVLERTVVGHLAKVERLANVEVQSFESARRAVQIKGRIPKILPVIVDGN